MNEENFEQLVKEVKEKKYVENDYGEITLSHKNADNLRVKGLEVNSEIVDRLFNRLKNDGYFETIPQSKEKNEIPNFLKKPLTLLIQIIFIILFMALIYFLAPSLDNNPSGQEDSDIYQMYYR